MESAYAADFRSGFIAESPRKLGRIIEYFAAVHGLGAFPAVRCNAPEFSAVVNATGRVQPCFFISDLPTYRPTRACPGLSTTARCASCAVP